MGLKQHLLLYTLLPLCVIALLLSFYRFIVAGDYIVAYEGSCDPTIESCFSGCTDDECSESYYYSKVEKMAYDVYAQCGPDVTDCAEASVCQPSDRHCSVTYCEPSEIEEGESCVHLREIEQSEEETVGDEAVDTQPL